MNFELYCSQCIVLGFNSSFYDLNVCKPLFAKVFEIDKSKCKFTVKRNNRYLCLSTDNFRFLDIGQYLTPTTTYSKFLTTFCVSEEKGYFPYDYFDSFDNLTPRHYLQLITSFQFLKMVTFSSKITLHTKTF